MGRRVVDATLLMFVALGRSALLLLLLLLCELFFLTSFLLF